MTMITPSYLGETIEYSSLHACRSTLEDPTSVRTRRSSNGRNAAVQSRPMGTGPSIRWQARKDNRQRNPKACAFHHSKPTSPPEESRCSVPSFIIASYSASP